MEVQRQCRQEEHFRMEAQRQFRQEERAMITIKEPKRKETVEKSEASNKEMFKTKAWEAAGRPMGLLSPQYQNNRRTLNKLLSAKDKKESLKKKQKQRPRPTHGTPESPIPI